MPRNLASNPTTCLISFKESECVNTFSSSSASYALLLELVAKVTGRKAKKLVMFLADVHIYENHLDQVKLQLSRQPLFLPALGIHLPTEGTPMAVLESIQPHHIWLENYTNHPAIKAPMAV